MAPDQQDALVFLGRVSGTGDRIFVAGAQNSRVNFNDSSFYFLADRLPATPYEELHPGVADTSAVQQ